MCILITSSNTLKMVFGASWTNLGTQVKQNSFICMYTYVCISLLLIRIYFLIIVLFRVLYIRQLFHYPVLDKTDFLKTNKASYSATKKNIHLTDPWSLHLVSSPLKLFHFWYFLLACDALTLPGFPGKNIRYYL